MSEGKNNKFAEAARLLESVAQDLLAGSSGANPSNADVILDEFRTLNVRRKLLPETMHSQIAWAIMTELYLAYLQAKPCCVKHVCLASGAPDTTVLRYLEPLVSEGWVRRSRSVSDKRVVRLMPTNRAIEVIEAWAERRANEMRVLLQSEKQTGRPSEIGPW